MNQDKFNQLYNFNQINNNIRNLNSVIYKLKPTLIKTTNHK